MGTLYKHGWYAKDMEKVDISIVDALTGPEPCYIKHLTGIDKSCIEGDFKRSPDLGEEIINSGRVESKMLAINFSDIISSIPPRILNPEENTGYAIFQLPEKGVKLIYQFPSDTTSFRNTILLTGYNNYIWDGTVEEIIEEFEKAGFDLRENIPNDDIQDLEDEYQNYIENRK